MRIIHLLVIGVLVFAAAYVYRIKMEFDRAHRARAAAACRNPRAARRHRGAARRMGQARRAAAAAGPRRTASDAEADQRHAITTSKNLPERPPSLVKPGDPDPIGAMIDTMQAAADAPAVTGSVPAPEDRR